MARTPRLPREARSAVKRAAQALTYSIERLARDLGVTAGTLFNYRTGRTRVPGSALSKLGKVLRRQAKSLERRYREVMRLMP
ncbi:MAG TPA: helix-turn-helix domain-containing protein [Gemmatimonadales bacterium]|jgi:transcriptional regulator with XRE-family HTH domain|nr:helix-turn-helix domain-containing protein [Gemmatimonadales bacterium]